jgi:Putative transposase
MQAIESTEMSAQSQRLDTAGRKALWHKDWVVYAKAPLGGAAQVLQYLSRYTHRSAIGNERIQRITEQEVFFSARATPPSLGRCRGLHAPCEPNPDHAVPRVPDRQTASDPDLGRIKAPARTAHVLRAKTASNSPMMKVQDSTHAP